MRGEKDLSLNALLWKSHTEVYACLDTACNCSEPFTRQNIEYMGQAHLLDKKSSKRE